MQTDIRTEYGMLEIDDRFSSISDQDLIREVQDIKKSMPDIGYNMYFELEEFMCHYQQSLQEVDPVNTALKWASPISRRVYCVPYPNFIWHLDGNHKLIR